MVLDVVVDIGVDVNLLFKEVYQLMVFRLVVKECIIMLQVGKDFEIEGFIVGLFNIYISLYFKEVDLKVVFLKDWMLLCLDVLLIKGLVLIWVVELWNYVIRIL